jgi:hypothetical protein
VVSDSLYDSRGAVAANVPKMASPASFLRPMTPYGDSYTQSYTKYLNAPGSSYVHPLFPLFNDRRPQQAKIRTTLRAPSTPRI